METNQSNRFQLTPIVPLQQAADSSVPRPTGWRGALFSLQQGVVSVARFAGVFLASALAVGLALLGLRLAWWIFWKSWDAIPTP